MPLTAKGEEIKSALTKEYGAEKGEQVLYAGKNKGTFTGIDCDKINRIADGVSRIAARFDAMVDSDAGMKPRMFGSYTTAQLKKSVSEGVNEWTPRETIEKMIKEIQARESGESKITSTPQIKGGKPNPKVGRM